MNDRRIPSSPCCLPKHLEKGQAGGSSFHLHEHCGPLSAAESFADKALRVMSL